MLTSIDVRISRLYSPVSRQVQEIKGCLLLIFFKQQMPPVELLSSCYCYDFRQQFGYFSFAKGIKVSAILYCSTKSTQPCPRVCRFAAHFFWHLCCTIDVIFHISQTSSKFVQRQLVTKNYPQDLSQSETECCTIDVVFHLSQTSSEFVQRQLVTENYPLDLSQSETDKYFE